MVEKSGAEYYIICDKCGEQYYEKGIVCDQWTFLSKEVSRMVEGARTDGWEVVMKDILYPELKPSATCYCCVYKNKKEALKMTAWDYAKSKGLTLKEISKETGQSLQTLRNWYNSDNKRNILEACIFWINNK